MNRWRSLGRTDRLASAIHSRWVWDRLLVPLMFAILSVFSVVQIMSIRSLTEAQKSLDLVTECTTPGTRCYQLSQESQAQRLKENERASNRAALCAVTALEGAQDFDQVRANFYQCINDAKSEPTGP